MCYNLLSEPWIPVLYHTGEWKRLGIRKTLEDAVKIRQVAASNPMDRVAILRFLLALLYWCQGSPPKDRETSVKEPLPQNWFAKLEHHADCFNLLGVGKRFYQYRGDSTKKLTVNYLLQEVPTGTNHWHFRHASDEKDGLCLACCALGLVRLPAFATSGGAGKPPGVNAKPPIYFLPHVETLSELLRDSWKRRQGDLGTPAWLQPNIRLPNSGEIPLLLGLTWLPRRVWLEEPTENGSCIACGTCQPLIRKMVFAPIGSQKTADDDAPRNWDDPHVCYSITEKRKKISLHAPDCLNSSDAGAGTWARVRGEITSNCPTGGRVDAVGFATVKNDKYLETRGFDINIVGSKEEFEGWYKAGRDLFNKLCKLLDPDKKRKDHYEIRSALVSIRPHVEHVVSAKIETLLTRDAEGWQVAADEYRQLMKAIGPSLAPGVTTAALRKRRRIAALKPDMSQAKEPDQKSKTNQEVNDDRD